MPRVRPGPRNVRVIVVRHGPAELRDPIQWPDDDRRPLTSKGRRQTARAARGIARLAKPVRKIATSAADRALATAEIVRHLSGGKADMETWEELASGRLAAPIFDRLRHSIRTGQDILLVGHEPTLAEFIGLSLSGDGQPLVRFAKGGAACIEFPAAITPGAGRLVWLLTRKQLSRVQH